MKRLKMLEKDIQRQICKYLQLKGYFFTRVNTIGLFDAKRGVRRKNPYITKGMPDILVFVPQKGIYGLEVKREGAYQSPEQKHFENMFDMAGGKYFVVRSIEDVQEIGL